MVFQFYLSGVNDAISEWHAFFPWPIPDGDPYPTQWYWVQMSDSIPSQSFVQWVIASYTGWTTEFDYPTNFLGKDISGGLPDIVYRKSVWVTQGTDLWTQLQASGNSSIPSSSWSFGFYMGAGGTYQVTFTLLIEVYKLSALGVEELLFSFTTGEITRTGTSLVYEEFTDTQPEFAVASTDRLVVKVYCNAEQGESVIRMYSGTSTPSSVSIEELPPSPLMLVNGWKIGEITINDNSFTAELRSRAQFLQQNIVKLYSPQCRADLGDADCTIDLNDSAGTYSYDGAVTSVSEDRYKFKDTNVPSYASGDVFTGGKITWSTPESADTYTGTNAGFSMEIKKYDPSTQQFTLFQPMPYDIAVDDEYVVTWGCDKTFATCRDQYSNTVHFRAEPHLPGRDKLKINKRNYNFGNWWA